MNPNNLAKHYEHLTPEERFRLILAAGARDDAIEQQRLASASGHISLTVRDYTPWAHAFQELAMLVFVELVEDATKQRETFHLWVEAARVSADEPPDDGETAASKSDDDSGEPDNAQQATSEDRLLGLYLSEGFILKTKAHGWKLFCDELSVPPFTIWQTLCGFERLQQALDRVEGDDAWPGGAAFLPEGMLRFFSEIRSENQPEPSMATLLSAECYAAELNAIFRKRAAWWGG